MIRDEARAILTRHAEVLVALGVLGLGILGLRQPGWILQGIGVVLVALGVGWARVAWRRVRFSTAGDGVGAVVVDEGQVTYFSPFDGGSLALDDLTGVTLRPGDAPVWTLSAAGQPPLNIPHAARGAAVLIDAFASLPGFRADRALAALDRPEGPVITVWRRGSDRRLTSE